MMTDHADVPDSLDAFITYAIRAADENLAQFDDKDYWRGFRDGLRQVQRRAAEIRGEGPNG